MTANADPNTNVVSLRPQPVMPGATSPYKIATRSPELILMLGLLEALGAGTKPQKRVVQRLHYIVMQLFRKDPDSDSAHDALVFVSKTMERIDGR